MSKVYRNYLNNIIQDVEDGLISLEDLQELIEDLESIKEKM